MQRPGHLQRKGELGMLQLIFNDYTANDQGVLVDGADGAAGSAVFRCAGAAFLGNAFQLTGNPSGNAAQQGEAGSIYLLSRVCVRTSALFGASSNSRR